MNLSKTLILSKVKLSKPIIKIVVGLSSIEKLKSVVISPSMCVPMS